MANLISIPNSTPHRTKWTTPSPLNPATSATNRRSLTRCLPPENPGLIFAAGPTAAWDTAAVASPVVNRYLTDRKEHWLMWYHADNSVGLAVSNNGVHWERGAGAVADSTGAGRVLQPSTDWWAFDTHSVRPAGTLIMSSDKLRSPSAVYWMYYTGFADTSTKSLPGLAMSQDGRHWARIEGEHHTGALLDVGSSGEWDSSCIAAPSVVYHGVGDMRMYYHSFECETNLFAVGLARSRDGIKWVKMGKVMEGGGAGEFDEGGVRNAHVVRRRGGGYVMVYEGVGGDGRTAIGAALSEDGLKGWRRCGEAVLEAEEGGVGEPCLVEMDGGEGWRLYYSGLGEGGRSGIGLAVSRGEELSGFQRWKGLNLL